ncbi:MAG: dihydrofolate reductase [Bacteroidetes bacterium]|nr:dihydrofolate reductase [Bacteroidota bacterium]
MISIIVAIAENYAIGKNNDLLWHIPEDLKMFKRITSGHTVVMGKKTYLSLPFRPLKNRENIVITDSPADVFEGCTLVYSIAEAMEKCNAEEENFIIGGASVYAQFLPFTDRLYLTWVNKKFEGDVFFPEIDFEEWEIISREDFPLDEQLGFSYSYIVYDRKKK